MGDIADSMLEGQMCMSCGVIISEEGLGFPGYCKGCQKDYDIDAAGGPSSKETCPVCGKRKKNVAQHMKDVHEEN